MPRPTRYRPDIAERILRLVREGSSLNDACRAVGIPRTTVNEWAFDDRDRFGGRLRQAEVERYRAWEDELIEHAKAELGSTNMAAVQARRTLLDQMRWIMARRVPEIWGEHVAHQHVLSGNASICIYLPSKGTESERGRVLEGAAVELLGDS
jgi:hypothetical protein